jgi:branched-chain amino acid transport system permease protein
MAARTAAPARATAGDGGPRARSWPDWIGPAFVAAAAAAGYVLLGDDLALLSRVVATAFLVLSLDLVVGLCGIATLGQAALFGVGAYAAGIACTHGLTEPILLLLIGALAGAAAGLLTGALVARFSGLPQLVLSIALVQLAAAIANKASSVTGGSDGLSGIEPGPVLGLFPFDLWGRTAYLFGVAVLLPVLVVLIRISRSPFGLLCRAIREDPVRVEAMGARVYPALVRMYMLSGAVAGIGGALSAVTAGVVGLDSVSFERSAEALVMLVLGGTGTLYGALVGTVVFQLFEHAVSAANPFHWMTLVGLLLIAVVLFLPRGLQSLGSIAGRLSPRREPP